MTLEIVEPGARSLDRLEMGDLVIDIDHVVMAPYDGAEVTVSTTSPDRGRGHRPDGDRRRARRRWTSSARWPRVARPPAGRRASTATAGRASDRVVPLRGVSDGEPSRSGRGPKSTPCTAPAFGSVVTASSRRPPARRSTSHTAGGSTSRSTRRGTGSRPSETLERRDACSSAGRPTTATRRPRRQRDGDVAGSAAPWRRCVVSSHPRATRVARHQGGAATSSTSGALRTATSCSASASSRPARGPVAGRGRPGLLEVE